MPDSGTGILTHSGVTPAQAAALSQLAYLAGTYPGISNYIGKDIVTGEFDGWDLFHRASSERSPEKLSNFRISWQDFERQLAGMRLVAATNQSGMQSIAIRLPNGAIVQAFAGTNEIADIVGPNAGIAFGNFGIDPNFTGPDSFPMSRRLNLTGPSEAVVSLSRSLYVQEQNFLRAADSSTRAILAAFPSMGAVTGTAGELRAG
jgi:hypothetical protein